MTAFPSRMREARQARRLTQRALGELAGLDKYAVLRIENGQKRLWLDEAVAIAAALELPLHRMLSNEPIETTVSLR